MTVLPRRILIAFLCLSLATFSTPVTTLAGMGLSHGAETAAEAAAPGLSGSEEGHAGRLRAAFAYADTTEYEFPEEEEEKRNVVKDVILWTGVAGFLAFFVIKVFLQGDTDTPPPPPNQKPPPPPPTVTGRPVWQSPW